MSVVTLSADMLDGLCDLALQSPRGRQHLNLHQSLDEACQRLLNAMNLDSYIRPHRHLADPKQETLIAVRGAFCLYTFDSQGKVVRSCKFGVGPAYEQFGFELSPETWHTVIALEAGSVLFEVKAGPFNPAAAKEMASWAPEEGSAEAPRYLTSLRERGAR